MVEGGRSVMRGKGEVKGEKKSLKKSKVTQKAVITNLTPTVIQQPSHNSHHTTITP